MIKAVLNLSTWDERSIAICCPRVRGLLKVPQVTHLHGRKPGAAAFNAGAAQSALKVGQVKSQALLMKSLHAGPRNKRLERVRTCRSSLETHTHTHTHLQLCEETKRFGLALI